MGVNHPFFSFIPASFLRMAKKGEAPGKLELKAENDSSSRFPCLHYKNP